MAGEEAGRTGRHAGAAPVHNHVALMARLESSVLTSLRMYMGFFTGIKQVLLLAVFGLLLSAPAVQAASAASERTYSVVVAPQMGAEAMHKAWAPLLDALSRETGLHFALQIPPSIPAQEVLLLRGQPDFAFVDPYLMLPARKAHGYVPLLRNGGTPLQGQLLVRDDSPAQSLRDLDGAVIAFPAPNAFGAALYLRAVLARAGVRFTPLYAGSHSNTHRHILLGQAAAGGGVNFSLDREPADVRKRLRAVYVTPPLIPHAFAAHPRVPAAVRARVVAALLRLAERPENRATFNAVEMPQPVRADYRRDYAPLEALGLDKYLVMQAD